MAQSESSQPRRLDVQTLPKETLMANHVAFAPYLAGLFEAGGSAFMVTRRSGTQTIRFTQSSKNEAFIKGLRADFGGSVQQNGNSFLWSVQGPLAESILTATAKMTPSLDALREELKPQAEATPTSITNETEENQISQTKEPTSNGARFRNIRRSQYPQRLMHNAMFIAGVFDSRQTIRKGTGDSYEVTITTVNSSLLHSMRIAHHGSKPFASETGDPGLSWAISGQNLFRVFMKTGPQFKHPEMQRLYEESIKRQKVVLDLLALHPYGIAVTDLANKTNACETNPDIPVGKLLQDLIAVGRVNTTIGRGRKIFYHLNLHPDNFEHIKLSPVMLERFFQSKLWDEDGGIVITPLGKVVAARYHTPKGYEWIWHNRPESKYVRERIREAESSSDPYERVGIDGNGYYYCIAPKGLKYIDGTLISKRVKKEITDAIKEALIDAAVAASEYETHLGGGLPQRSALEEPEEIAEELYATPPKR